MRPHDGGPSQAVPRARRPRPHVSRPVAAGLVALVAYGWWFTDLQPFSGGALLGLLGAVAGLIALGTARRRSADGHERESATAPAPALRQRVIARSVTVTVLVGWELIALFSQPRKDHP